jgi:F-type H+-transporting ATPase subunit gamma
MTQRQELERHRHSLGEIRDIMNSMKTLAYMETRKLSRFLDAQHAVVASIGDLAADFLSFYPEALPEADELPPVYLLVGSERGFCGDLNQTLLDYLRSAREQYPFDQTTLIGVGRKLNMLLEKDSSVAALIDGASVVEEIPVVLNELVRELSSLQETHGIVSLYGIYHGSLEGIVMQKLLPPFQHYRHQPPKFPHPPVLNMSPADFLIELTEQYLFAALHEMLYTSLMIENRSRVSHLEGAVQHLDDESEKLARKCNALRQEEIIEEIEVILLSAASIDESR